MPPASRILDRFRRLLAPPGRPAEGLGVPADGEELEAELLVLLEELDAIGSEAARIEDEAAKEAARRRDRAVHEAAAILEEARGRADAARAEAAAARRDEVRGELDVAREEAAREIARVRGGLESRLTPLVEEVVACVRSAGR